MLLPGPNGTPHLCGADTQGEAGLPPPSMAESPQQHLMQVPGRSTSPLVCTCFCFTGKCLSSVLFCRGKGKGKAEEGRVKLLVLWDVVSVLPKCVIRSPPSYKCPCFSQT